MHAATQYHAEEVKQCHAIRMFGLGESHQHTTHASGIQMYDIQQVRRTVIAQNQSSSASTVFALMRFKKVPPYVQLHRNCRHAVVYI